MKGFTVAVIWGFVVMLVLSITYPIWNWAIGFIVTSAGGDSVTVLLADIIFVIMCIAIIGAIFLYRSNPGIDRFG